LGLVRSSCILNVLIVPMDHSLLSAVGARRPHNGARDLARDLSKTGAYVTSRCERKKVEMLFAHLKCILKLDRLRFQPPCPSSPRLRISA
jgi:hypothetical protein